METVREGAKKRMKIVTDGIERLELERKVMLLAHEISDEMMRVSREYGKLEAVLLLGKEEIKLLYTASDLNIHGMASNIDLDERGFLTMIWGSKIYYTGENSGVKVVVHVDKVDLLDYLLE